LKQTKDALMDDHKKQIPLINSFCNAGLQERHWKEINELLHAGDSLSPEASVQVVQGRGVGSEDPKVLAKLDEISDKASKEFSNERTL
jgi:dynein heavy chain